jgi:alkylation response protein AidB-like acyl-CoA dehydrogenase
MDMIARRRGRGGCRRAEVVQHAMELHGGNGAMLDFGIEKLFRDGSIFLHMDATADISRFKIVKAMFPRTAGAYAGPED